MLKYISFKRNVLASCGKCVPANSFGRTFKNSGKDLNLNKPLNFEDIPGPRSYSLVGTLHKYLPIIGKSEMNVIVIIYVPIPIL